MLDIFALVASLLIGIGSYLIAMKYVQPDRSRTIFGLILAGLIPVLFGYLLVRFFGLDQAQMTRLGIWGFAIVGLLGWLMAEGVERRRREARMNRQLDKSSTEG